MRARYFWPIVLILAGVIFLLSNLGILPGSAWGWVWALALILLGVSMLWPGRRGVESADVSVPLGGAAAARLTLKHGAGQLSVRSGAAADLLLTGVCRGGVDKDIRPEGDHLDVTLRVPAQDWGPWMWPGVWGRGGLDWNLSLNPSVPLVLALETGASECRLDLSQLCVTDLSIKTGASSTVVTLPAQAGYTRVRLESGAASVKVQVPDGVAARVRGVMGVGALNVDGRRFPQRGGEYQSADFETAAHRVEIEVEGGVGAVEVR
jgi:hypothetical protein